MKTKIIAVLLMIVSVLTITACQSTDVVGKYASSSFEALLKKIPDSVSYDNSNNGWSLVSPTGERFIWSKDLSVSSSDVMLEFDAKPFIDAGLNTSKLAEEININADKIVIKAELGDNKFEYSNEPTPSDSFNQIIKARRDLIGYHDALDHYGISIGSGNMFEWAKDMNTNDKDIVFVLNPEPFINAGVDPEKIEGWIYAQIEMMGRDGRPEKVYKLLKPFDLG